MYICKYVCMYMMCACVYMCSCACVCLCTCVCRECVICYDSSASPGNTRVSYASATRVSDAWNSSGDKQTTIPWKCPP